jgi:prepilin-type N-terminal cleavage/methylation domain-containing protein
MSSKHRRGERGTTLLESLVAVALFGIASAAIGTLLTQHIRTQGTNMTQTSAIGIAERELEDLRAMDYGDIASRTSTTTVASMTYNLTTTVTANTPATNMKSINTTVTWTEARGPQTVSLNAIYTAVKR